MQLLETSHPTYLRRLAREAKDAMMNSSVYAADLHMPIGLQRVYGIRFHHGLLQARRLSGHRTIWRTINQDTLTNGVASIVASRKP